MTARNITFGMLGVALLVGCYWFPGSIRGTKVYAQAPAGSAKPFQAEIEMYTYEHNPEGKLFFRRVLGRNSAGTSVTVERHGPGFVLVNRTIQVGGQKVDINDATNLKTTSIAPGSAVAVASGVVTCGPSVREEELAGVRTQVVPFTAKQIRMTEWRAPDLGCAVLAYRVEKQDSSGAWGLLTTTRLVNLTLQEPDPRLFDDSGYKEVVPSEYELKGLSQAGMPDSIVSDELRNRLARRDAAYKARNAAGN